MGARSQGICHGAFRLMIFHSEHLLQAMAQSCATKEVVRSSDSRSRALGLQMEVSFGLNERNIEGVQSVNGAN